MSAIRIMDPHLAAKIAAGEVIERPASVVKELVENALDAGARHIRVEIMGGGAERLVVSDDGHGMAADDVELAFRRHATSKLHAESDLDTLATLGFRGEALPSIAAVADVTCTTRASDEPVGRELSVTAGVIDQRSLARTPGTTMTVDGLFARFPARRKFLRARSAEAAACVQTVAPLALAFPEVQFVVAVDGREALRTPGDGHLRHAAIAVLGLDIADHLLDIPATTVEDERDATATVVEVAGVCASGSHHRPDRGGVTVLVNRRPVSNRTLSYAIVEAYGSLVPVGRHPVAILNVHVPPAEVDFNVHPSKLEIKLLRERAVYAGIQRGLRAALASDAWSIGAWSHDEPGDGRLDDQPLRELRILGQANRMYVIAEGLAGVYLVDQHAAHERVLLEQLRGSLGERSESQMLLEPLVLDVPPAAVAMADTAAADLAGLGLRVEPFGPTQIMLRAIPAVLVDRDPARALREAFATLVSNSHGLTIEQNASWAERLALVLACKSAVRAGDSLSQPEMEALLRRLGEAEMCRTCAHGRPTAILLSHAQLEREFRRR